MAANLSYYHDDPDRMSFLSYAIPQASYLSGGGHYVRGGSAALTDGLVALIREAGGIVEAGREVDTLLVNLAGVSGVRHRTKRPRRRRRSTMHRLYSAMPRLTGWPKCCRRRRGEQFLAPYAHRPLSISLWTVSIGLRRPASEFGVRHYSTFVLPAWMKALSGLRDTSAVMAEPDGERLPSYVFVDYHQIDSGLNQTGPLPRLLLRHRPAGKLDRARSRRRKSERKERWMDRLIADLDREFPGNRRRRGAP